MKQEAWRPTIVFAIFALVLGILISYAPQLVYKFLVPVGGDSYSHLQTVLRLVDGDIGGAIDRYPPFFHAFPALLSKLSVLTPIEALVWFSPVLLTLSALSLAYVAGRWLKSWPAALVVFGLSLFAALQPLQIWTDGGFPNVFASYIFLPIGLWSLANYFSEEKDRTGLYVFLGIGVLIFITHHLTMATYLIISFAYLLFLFFNQKAGADVKALEDKFNILKRVILILGLLSLIAIPLGFTRRIFDLVFEFSSSFPFLIFARGLESPFSILDLGEIPFALGWEVALLGGAGLILSWADKNIAWQVKMLFSVWILVLFILSQIPGLVFPIRFARELGVPLTILAGFAIVKVFQSLPLILKLLWIPLIMTLVLSGTVTKVKKVLELPERIEFTEYDLAAAQYLNYADGDECVYVLPRTRYYQYFTSLDTEAYSLNSGIRKNFDRLVAGEATNFSKNCRYVAVERIPGEFDWSTALLEKGYILEASFDGEMRGSRIFYKLNFSKTEEGNE